MTQKPFAEGLFTWPPSDEPRLIGSRCSKCGLTTFPKQASCPGCPSETMEEIELEPQGTLWVFTTQEFRPKLPYRGPEDPNAEWKPYGVGYVDFGDIRVEGRLTESDPAKLKIGMKMKLALIPFGTDDEGNELLNYRVRARRPSQELNEPR